MDMPPQFIQTAGTTKIFSEVYGEQNYTTQIQLQLRLCIYVTTSLEAELHRMRLVPASSHRLLLESAEADLNSRFIRAL